MSQLLRHTGRVAHQRTTPVLVFEEHMHQHLIFFHSPCALAGFTVCRVVGAPRHNYTMHPQCTSTNYISVHQRLVTSALLLFYCSVRLPLFVIFLTSPPSPLPSIPFLSSPLFSGPVHFSFFSYTPSSSSPSFYSPLICFHCVINYSSSSPTLPPII